MELATETEQMKEIHLFCSVPCGSQVQSLLTVTMFSHHLAFFHAYKSKYVYRIPNEKTVFVAEQIR